MKLTNGFDISASALTAQRLRMDVISSNIANAETTRGKYVDGEWIPYQRKMVVLESKENGSFKNILNGQMQEAGEGVRVSRIINDPSDFKLVYEPSNPDSDAQGYVRKPNVDPLKEMVDLMAATKSYEANVTVLNASKNMLLKALEIGRA